MQCNKNHARTQMSGPVNTILISHTSKPMMPTQHMRAINIICVISRPSMYEQNWTGTLTHFCRRVMVRDGYVLNHELLALRLAAGLCDGEAWRCSTYRCPVLIWFQLPGERSKEACCLSARSLGLSAARLVSSNALRRKLLESDSASPYIS
jgi:hypothetical protein